VGQREGNCEYVYSAVHAFFAGGGNSGAGGWAYWVLVKWQGVGCSSVWNFSVASLAVLTEVERRSRTGLAKWFNGQCQNCL
jgi:hypothetical protein